jgi:hypothetical protein
VGLGPSILLEAEALSCDCLADTAYIGMNSLLSLRYYLAGVTVLLFTPDDIGRPAAGLASCGTSFLVGDS